MIIQKRNKHKSGVTLFETIIVILVLSSLALAGAIGIPTQLIKARDIERKADLSHLGDSGRGDERSDLHHSQYAEKHEEKNLKIANEKIDDCLLLNSLTGHIGYPFKQPDRELNQ